MVKKEFSLGFFVNWHQLSQISTMMWPISSRITLRVLRCIPLLEVLHGEDRTVTRFFFFLFFLLIGIDDRKSLPSCDQ